ncbi:FAD binding domain-containing protein [Pseudaminobacter sp. 19-2017]|uniref:FAD binding domain-containing protein n=1 Tax=Pseudaminobacter soli (ex Zhang et al. 2022) TaxID=2831468 RepID=A0A942E2A2_9HYPH|nr:FAD binding domain-containing protein [Pseudaminobacter soli]MBS3649853.1 FAD binding domain-containing protein [Pseudaminobacter soli]
MGLVLRSFATVNEAGAALSEPGARYLGGGTLAVRAVNEGDVSVHSLVRITDPQLSRIELSEGRARIGASVTMARVAANPGIAFLAPAAMAVGGPAVRNMATVGGNLFAPAPYGDFAVALLALDAKVDARKDMPMERFLETRGALAKGSIVTAVSFALPSEGGFRFRKVSRVKPKGTSVLSIAAVIEEDPDGTIRSARIALGCMADRPIRAHAAERALVGSRRTEQGIAAALAVAGEGTHPVTDPVASAWYRAEVLPVHLRRLLLY